MEQALSDLITWAGDALKAAPLIELLICLMAADVVTGVSLAITRRELNSSVSAVGMLRKVVVLVLVGVCIQLQRLAPDAPVGTVGTLFFCGAEGLSLVENAGLLGVPLPSWFKGVFEKFQREPSSKRAKREPVSTD